MEQQDRVSRVSKMMLEFAARTGLEPSGTKPRRYLWTDAFAVCNFLALHQQTGESRYKELALHLVDQVHHILGRYAEGDSRSGWISGLTDDEGEKHPTRGGLRIGKPLPERRPGEPINERLEWDRDGQYYHYLTKWMLALNRLSAQTGDGRFRGWALELARAAHAGFVFRSPSGTGKRMCWKMSIDLKRPLVASMGHHDPLDGLLTCLELVTAECEAGCSGQSEPLQAEIADMKAICKGQNWTTDDPLGLGGILGDGLRAAALMLKGRADLEPLLLDLMKAAGAGLSFFMAGTTLHNQAEYRLAFRELGLSIGLHSAERTEMILTAHPGVFADRQRLLKRLDDILRYQPLSGTIEEFWLRDENRQTEAWKEHEDINSVMFATSLLPGGYFG